jgi:hypothetical protein
MKSLQFVGRNILIIGVFCILFLFVALYIDRTFVDVPYLDGLMMVPNVEKYFDHTLSIQDIDQRWFEHRLIGYAVIFLMNAIVFGLNMKLDAFIFLISYFLIGLLLYFPYRKFLTVQLKNKMDKSIDISYAFILAAIFSLVHPPIMLMGAQFVIGTLLFVLAAIFFDRICHDTKNVGLFIGFLLSIFLYITIFSGAYYVETVVSLAACVLCRVFFAHKKGDVFLFLSVLFTLALAVWYFLTTGVNQDGVSLFGKIAVFIGDYKESFLTLLAGVSATTLDMHTFQEVLNGNDAIVMLNGSILLLLGIYALFRFVTLRMYNITYLPLMLLFFSIGSIVIIRLGRLGGGWIQPMNDWYSFHLYFYLVGIVWILFYDVFKKYDDFFDKPLGLFLNKNKLIVGMCVFAVVWIYSFQAVSNVAQWRRAVYVKQWLETKRQAMLFPTNESLETLLWPKEKAAAAINVLKAHNLSVFRGIHSENIIKVSGWSLDGWIKKSATVMVSSGKDGILTIKVSLPEDVYTRIYKDSLILEVVANGVIVNTKDFAVGAFDNGAVDVISNIPKNETLNVEIRLDKSFVPVDYSMSNDSRELGIMINKIEVK